jgi:hypothetical protein
MRNFHFTTVVSSNYLYKFLAMQSSLDSCCKNYHLFALCVDTEAYNMLKSLPLTNLTILNAADFETGELLQAKNNRSYHEYCWTLKPFMLNHAVRNYKDTRYFAHIDADLYFFCDPIQIINENPEASLFITDHNNSERFLFCYESAGIYNTGFVGCKNNETAEAAVSWWYARCLEKCCLIANVEEGIYGDQKYVERWPDLFPGVHPVVTKGANVAQWNIEGLYIHDREGAVYVNNDPLIFYHFSGFSIIDKREYNLSTFYKIDTNPLKLIYEPYMRELYKQIQLVGKWRPEFKSGMMERKYVRCIHIKKI